METIESIRFPVSRATLIWGYIVRFTLTGIICWYGLSRDADFAVFYFLMLFPLLLVLWINFLKIPTEVIFREHQLVFKAVVGTVRMNIKDILYMDDVDGGRYTRFETFDSWILIPPKINKKAELGSIIKKLNPGVNFPLPKKEAELRAKFRKGIQIAILCMVCVLFVSFCVWLRHGEIPDMDYLSSIVILFALCMSLLYVYWDLPHRIAPTKSSITRNTAKWFYIVSLAYFRETGANTVDTDGPRGFTPDPNVTISGGAMSVSDDGTVSFASPMMFRYVGTSEEFLLQPDGSVLTATDALITSAEKGDVHQVNQLLAHGFDIHKRNGDYDTAYMAALQGGNPEVLIALLNKGHNHRTSML